MEISNIILFGLLFFFTISSVRTVKKSIKIDKNNNKYICDSDH